MARTRGVRESRELPTCLLCRRSERETARCQVLASREHKKVVARGTEGRWDFQREKCKDDFFQNARKYLVRGIAGIPCALI